ncbi:chemocyanin-like [Zingiber officinale]|uniref:Phytocyanin domain-containing protein n=1 Tax=Zingiber officinale TaxID=94328 RepID=A0A8J5BYD9_ZINOF|nr:chemocyanin-like [Zingiber officinale]KAG6468608.1 hypothetical protein ZIOFF_073297 [Zingiber officinale]
MSKGGSSTSTTLSGLLPIKTLHVGDTIVFEYDKERVNGMVVSLDDFRSCSSSRPIRIYQTGLDKFISVKRAHLYFICGFPDHCLRGQKFDIRILESPALLPQTTTRSSKDTQTQPLSSNSSPPPQPGQCETKIAVKQIPADPRSRTKLEETTKKQKT